MASRPKNVSDVGSISALNAFLLTDAAAPHALLFGAEWDAASRAGGAMDALLSAPLHVVLNGREIAPTVSHATLLKATAERGGTLVEVHGGVARPRRAPTR
jgi:hypothetical protein